MTVRPVTGLKVRASLFFMPQSSWWEPLRKKPGAVCGRSAWYRSPSLSASGMEFLRPNFCLADDGEPACHNGGCHGDPARTLRAVAPRIEAVRFEPQRKAAAILPPSTVV